MNFKKIIICAIFVIFSISIIGQAQTKKVNLSQVPDGTYLGKYTATYKTAKGSYEGKVTVEGGKLVKVVLTKCAHGSGPSRGKVAYDKMIKANDIYVDGISGATWVGLVENALTTLTQAK